jgi:uncharacterized repeat protein (TIGR03803 family)
MPRPSVTGEQLTRINTYSGGAHFDGTIFEMTPGGTLIILHNFDSIERRVSLRKVDGTLAVGRDSPDEGHGFSRAAQSRNR